MLYNVCCLEAKYIKPKNLLFSNTGDFIFIKDKQCIEIYFHPVFKIINWWILPDAYIIYSLGK